MYQSNPEINIEVFVHKADALADDYRIGLFALRLSNRLSSYFIPFSPETYRHVQQRVFDELTDTTVDVDALPLQFHLTSIWDHTILESFSQLVQRLIEPLPYLEELLNVFCAVCGSVYSGSTYCSFIPRLELTSTQVFPLRQQLSHIRGHRCISS